MLVLHLAYFLASYLSPVHSSKLWDEKVTLLPKQDDNTEYLCSLGYKVLVKMTHSPLISHLVYAQERIREHQRYTQTCQHMTNNLRTALRMHSQIITAHVSQLVNVRRGVTKGMLFAARCATLFFSTCLRWVCGVYSVEWRPTERAHTTHVTSRVMHLPECTRGILHKQQVECRCKMMGRLDCMAK